MNCFNHSEIPAVAYCRVCGKALCGECKRTAQGTIFCEEHLPETARSSTGAAAPPPPVVVVQAPSVHSDVSPGLACLLGFIPGVGAIYNGQYAKGLVHAIIFGLLVSIVSSNAAGDLEPLFGILIGVWVIYMALEAYHTARKRRAGEPVDEFSSMLNLRAHSGGFPVGAISLIALGILLLLSTMDLIQFRYLVRYWPILLIVLGAYMLYARLSSAPVGGQEVRHER